MPPVSAGQVDAVTGAAETQLHAAVHQPLGVQARAHAGLVEHVDARLLEHPGANAGEHVSAAAALENHVVDAGAVQKLSEQQARRAGSDDGYLHAFGRHGSPLLTP